MKLKHIATMILVCILSACSIKSPIQNKYKLDAFGTEVHKGTPYVSSIYVSPPLAAEGYETEQMAYIIKPFELNYFAKNAWVGDPAQMLSPLIVQSLQNSHFFYAVTSIPYADKANYRIDTHLFSFQQNFLLKPSVFEMKVKNVITNALDSRVVSSKIFSYRMPAPMDAPYGGVIAANKVTECYTKDLTNFTIQSIQKDRKNGHSR